MRMNLHRQKAFYLLLLIIGCSVTALAQEKAADGIASTISRAVNVNPNSATSVSVNAEANHDIDALKTQLSIQQAQIDELKQALGEQKKLVNELMGRYGASQASVKPAPAEAGAARADPAFNISNPNSAASSTAKAIVHRGTDIEASPLTFKLGKVYLTPLGFLEFTTVVRGKNVGSGLGTNFASVPFANTTSGNLSEYRFSAQNSRIGFRLDAQRNDTRIIGYFESDFIGFSPGNVAVTTNSNNPRVRLLWVDARKGKWEVLGGQSWSLLTPNRKGLSPLPADVFNTLNIDPSNQVGLVWNRDPQFRAIYHASKTMTVGVSLEESEQYGGGSAGAGKITLPAALADAYGPQLNTGDSTFNVPNFHPDIIFKIAFDPNPHLHYELAGLLSSFKFFNPLDQRTHSATGGGFSAGINYELLKNFRLIANGFFSDGGGRWIFGLGPDLIIKGNGEPSLVHSASTLSGIEYQATPKDFFDAYYGAVYIQRNTALDPANGQLVGYGYSGSPLNHSRTIQEITLGYVRTLWRDPNYGGLQFMTQYSHASRNPWSVPQGQPAAAHLNMIYMSFRYLFPGMPPDLK